MRFSPGRPRCSAKRAAIRLNALQLRPPTLLCQIYQVESVNKGELRGYRPAGKGCGHAGQDPYQYLGLKQYRAQKRLDCAPTRQRRAMKCFSGTAIQKTIVPMLQRGNNQQSSLSTAQSKQKGRLRTAAGPFSWHKRVTQIHKFFSSQMRMLCIRL